MKMGYLVGTTLTERYPVVASTGVAGVIATVTAVLSGTAVTADRKGTFQNIGVNISGPAANGFAVVDLKLG